MDAALSFVWPMWSGFARPHRGHISRIAGCAVPLLLLSGSPAAAQSSNVAVPLPVLAGLLVVLVGLVAAVVIMTIRNRALHTASQFDRNTGLVNRAVLDASLAHEIHRRARSKGDLCVAMIDIDNFKKINDRFGHLRGDKVLAELGGLFRSLSRASDVLGRWGGEEFLLILPDTAQDSAMIACDRIRSSVQAHAFSVLKPVTISIGIAQAVEGETAEDLIRRADAAMYRAKEEGRNRCSVA